MKDDEFVKAVYSGDFDKADSELDKLVNLTGHHYKKINEAISDAIKDMRGKYGSDDFLKRKIKDMVVGARDEALDKLYNLGAGVKDDVVNKAMLFAELMHKNQTRKYTNAPYITHLAEVAAITNAYFPEDKEAIAVAWLHDCVEDQNVTREQLELHFNKTIADGVLWLSDISKPEDGNRERRKEIDRLHILAAPIRWQNVKLADLISNTRDILEHDAEGFGRVYLKEKKALMNEMRGVDDRIFQHALRITL